MKAFCKFCGVEVEDDQLTNSGICPVEIEVACRYRMRQQLEALRVQVRNGLPKPHEFKPRFAKFERVHVENKPSGVCIVKDVEEQAPGCYRYLVERTETFFAHEQALAKAPSENT